MIVENPTQIVVGSIHAESPGAGHEVAVDHAVLIAGSQEDLAEAILAHSGDHEAAEHISAAFFDQGEIELGGFVGRPHDAGLFSIDGDQTTEFLHRIIVRIIAIILDEGAHDGDPLALVKILHDRAVGIGLQRDGAVAVNLVEEDRPVLQGGIEHVLQRHRSAPFGQESEVDLHRTRIERHVDSTGLGRQERVEWCRIRLISGVLRLGLEDPLSDLEVEDDGAVLKVPARIVLAHIDCECTVESGRGVNPEIDRLSGTIGRISIDVMVDEEAEGRLDQSRIRNQHQRCIVHHGRVHQRGHVERWIIDAEGPVPCDILSAGQKIGREAARERLHHPLPGHIGLLIECFEHVGVFIPTGHRCGVGIAFSVEEEVSRRTHAGLRHHRTLQHILTDREVLTDHRIPNHDVNGEIDLGAHGQLEGEIAIIIGHGILCDSSPLDIDHLVLVRHQGIILLGRLEHDRAIDPLRGDIAHDQAFEILINQLNLLV